MKLITYGLAALGATLTAAPLAAQEQDVTAISFSNFGGCSSLLGRILEDDRKAKIAAGETTAVDYRFHHIFWCEKRGNSWYITPTGW